MDDVLALLREYGHRRGNHAPMGAEALVAIGHGRDAVAWTRNYIDQHGMAQRPVGRELGADEWSEALGNQDRIGDWNTTMRAHVAARPWAEVVREWLPRLMPGLAAAATPGVIRTAHALRSIERADTELRRNEVADGLAYWAAYYQPVAALSSSGGTARLASQALGDVPIVDKRRRSRQMMVSLEARARDARFLAVANGARPAPGREGEFLTDLTSTFAGLYAAHGADQPVPFIHAVTGPAAVRLLFPYVEADARTNALSYAWHTAAGLWSSFAPGPATRSPVQPETRDWRTLLARAVDNGDVHAIKLTEACWREADTAPDATHYLAAAADVVERL